LIKICWSWPGSKKITEVSFDHDGDESNYEEEEEDETD
jgi:hypothetical protein